ncbi:hypothetical protein [Acinetobacter sp. P1(2025)]|uniref:hypothetical protein n=1 Tax=Acinetobacter sp. P1(2025) TaxID=3446120 RepID=UPI003F529CE7
MKKILLCLAVGILVSGCDKKIEEPENFGGNAIHQDSRNSPTPEQMKRESENIAYFKYIKDAPKRALKQQSYNIEFMKGHFKHPNRAVVKPTSANCGTVKSKDFGTKPYRYVINFPYYYIDTDSGFLTNSIIPMTREIFDENWQNKECESPNNSDQ